MQDIILSWLSPRPSFPHASRKCSFWSGSGRHPGGLHGRTAVLDDGPALLGHLSLGPFWNTRVIVLPDAEVVRKAPTAGCGTPTTWP